jgi:hypothetical protein
MTADFAFLQQSKTFNYLSEYFLNIFVQELILKVLLRSNCLYAINNCPILEYVPSSQTPTDFKRSTSPTSPGVYPFGCDKLIQCPNDVQQTCGCKNIQDPENSAIVYNMRSSGDWSVLMKRD